MTTDLSPFLVRELMACSSAIADRRNIEQNLSSLRGHDAVGTPFFPVLTLQVLAHNVEELTGGAYTVRRADQAMSSTIPSGMAMFAVRCPIDTPDETIVYPTAEMDLMLIMPNLDGFHFGLATVDKETIERRLTERALRRQEQEQLRVEREERDKRITSYIEVIVEGIAFYNRVQATSRTADAFIGSSWREGLGSMRVNDLLEICDSLGVDLQMVIQRGIEHLPHKSD